MYWDRGMSVERRNISCLLWKEGVFVLLSVPLDNILHGTGYIINVIKDNRLYITGHVNINHRDENTIS